MKTYWLFMETTYHPNGGIDDLVGIFSNLEDAKKDVVYVPPVSEKTIPWSRQSPMKLIEHAKLYCPNHGINYSRDTAYVVEVKGDYTNTVCWMTRDVYGEHPDGFAGVWHDGEPQ